MTVDKWMVKLGKQAEHKKLMQKFHKFMKDSAAMFNGMKLVGEYTPMFGLKRKLSDGDIVRIYGI
ncbi:MAG: hypothetical protein JSV05_03115 [Candidatus Bathyarchaeota archaeon]|nr:MAG: hypothetical protein JSV05_03115 [Candidatus Bathyarchaeota archaeon]